MPPKVLRGIPLPWQALDANLQGVLDMDVRENDVFIVSYPKSGTNWLRSIINCMLDCPEEQNNLDLPMELSVCTSTSQEDLEAAPKMYKLLESWVSPRVTLTHLPPHLLPSQMFEKKAKVVYIARNPKDVLVSYYHFFNALVAEQPRPWEKFVSDFMRGEVSYGSWFTHTKQYWEMRDHGNFLFVKYEDLKKDEKAVIKQVGAFLGRDLDEKKIADISSQCSVQSMRRRFKEEPLVMSKMVDETKSEFIRKGKVGSWREQLSDAQSKRIDQHFEEHLGNTGLTFDFD